MKILSLALVLGLASSPPLAAAGKTKLLLIWSEHDHPAGTHRYPEVCRLLAHCLEHSPDVETVVSKRWPSDPVLLRDVKAVVLYTRPGDDILLDPQCRAQAEALLASGVGLTAIHWATGANPDRGPDYLALLGGWFNRPLFSTLEFATAKLTQVDPRHSICRGWEPFDHHDEYYLNLRFMPEAKPLLKATVGGKAHVVAWTYARPGSHGGRSFGVVLGHFYDNFKIEAFRKMLLNGILWTAHREVPAAGAPATADASQFEAESVRGPGEK